MDKVRTYTPTNFRKNIYSLLNDVKHNKDIRITLQPKHGGPNSNIFVTNQKKLDYLLSKLQTLEDNELARKIDLMSSKLSDNPVFDNPKDFEKWCEQTDD